jgi:hypothetical protein
MYHYTLHPLSDVEISEQWDSLRNLLRNTVLMQETKADEQEDVNAELSEPSVSHTPEPDVLIERWLHVTPVNGDTTKTSDVTDYLDDKSKLLATKLFDGNVKDLWKEDAEQAGIIDIISTMLRKIGVGFYNIQQALDSSTFQAPWNRTTMLEVDRKLQSLVILLTPTPESDMHSWTLTPANQQGFQRHVFREWLSMDPTHVEAWNLHKDITMHKDITKRVSSSSS